MARTHRDRRRLAIWSAPLLVAAGLTALAAPASGAPTGTLMVVPSTGSTDTDGDIVLLASTSCPGATHGRLSITGAGFPDRSGVFATVANADKPVSVPLGVTWNALAAILHAPVPLSGTAVVRFVCSDADERVNYGEFATVVEFTPGEARSGSYAAHDPESGRTMQVPVRPAASPSPAATPVASPPPRAGEAPLRPQVVAPPSTSPEPLVATPPDAPRVPGTGEVPSSLGETLWPQGFDAEVGSSVTPPGITSGTPTPGTTPDFAPDNTQTLASTIAAAAEDAALGGFSMTLDSTGEKAGFGAPIRVADFLLTTTQLTPVTVRDNRPGGPAWTVSAQVENFSSDLSGRYLGWTPYLISPGAGARPGDSIVSGFFGGNGLLEPRVLASAEDGHPPGFATFGAALDLRFPVTTPPGTYSTTLTITALS